MAHITSDKLLGWAIPVIGFLIILLLNDIRDDVKNNANRSVEQGQKLASIATKIQTMDERIERFENSAFNGYTTANTVASTLNSG